MHHPTAAVTALCILLVGAAPSAAWQSELYGPDWSPTPDLSFEHDKIIQDFSYAGYRKGEAPIPDMADAAIFDVVADFDADPTGTRDSTLNIRAALAAAKQAGGGVVYLPEGLYRVQPQDEEHYALRIDGDGIVLRGAGVDKTFILNTATNMRSKAVILLEGPESARMSVEEEPLVRITRDLMGPTRHIPVEDASAFKVGDRIVINADVTDDWVREHNEPDWLGQDDPDNRFMHLGSFVYLCDVVVVYKDENIIEIDIPTRYFLRTRDNARIYPKTNMLREVGVEYLSIGNVEHPGKTEEEWLHNAWTNPEHEGGYHSHASWLIDVVRVCDGWVRHINSFQYEGNGTTTHMLSNGIRLMGSARITVAHCHMQRPQYGGGGGNGYMFRLRDSGDALVKDSIAEFSRHGLVFSHVGSAGNVLLRCIDRDTRRSTGATGNVRTSGRYSDHHMKFSHSNLLDNCIAQSSAFVAFYRSGENHKISSAHTVFWNTRGEVSPNAERYGLERETFVVWSEQARYGYVIGTRGEISDARVDHRNRRYRDRTDPEDHLEGVGEGDTLDPPSLYLHQLKRRLGTAME